MTVDKFVIVTPVYEDKASARRLFKELAAQFGERIYVVAVDDGSVHEPVDSSWLGEAGAQGCVLTLGQNVGHQKAIAIGICYAAENFPDMPVLTIDSDGEDMPETIHNLINVLDDKTDVVVAKRMKRVETAKFKIFYAIYKMVFKLLTGRTIDFGNFAFYSPLAIARLSKMAQLWIHIAGTVLSSRIRIKYVPLDRGPRYAGKSKMNFVALVLHGFRGLMVFAEDVLVRVGIICFGTIVLTVAGVVIAVFLKLIGLATPGWFSVVIGVFFLILLQTGFMTLITLLLTGVMKGVLSTSPDYRYFIKRINHVENS